MVGKTISHYQILEKLGEGGMGIVYKAQDLKLDRFVALKFLPPHLTASEEEKQRFIHEAKAASSLDHNNICAIHEIDETEDGQLFISMAYYEGDTLDKKIKEKPLPIDEAIDIAHQIAEGLAKAHEKEIVHRDIKPANIMLTTDGVVKILDFGLAKLSSLTKLTRESTTLGTVSYMSPEQAKGEDVDYRTDIWSLAIIVYEMLAGMLPFKGEYESAVIYSIVNDMQEPITSLRSGLPMELEQILNKCLEKNASNRYQHIDDLMVDIRRVKKDSDSKIDSSRKDVKIEPPKKRFKSMIIPVIILIIIIMIVGGYFFINQIIPLDKPQSTKVSETRWENSIAVLPFEDISPEKDQEWFCDGMTEQVISNLGRLRNLKVSARQSVMKYKDSEKTIPEIGKELNVAHVLESSIRKSGDRIRVTAQLIKTDDGFHLWSQDFDRTLDDIFDIQDDISEKIASALLTTLSPEEKKDIKTQRPSSTEAYEYYIKGRYYHEKYWLYYDFDDLLTSEKMLKTAIKLDPDFADSYASLADLYNTYYNELPDTVKERDTYWRLQESYLDTAYQIDPNSAEVQNAKGWVHEAKYEFNEAFYSFKSAIKRNPNDGSYYSSMATFLIRRGCYRLAIRCITRAIEINSLDYESYCARANFHRVLGELNEAESDIKKALKIEANEYVKRDYFYILIIKKQYEEARKYLTQLKSENPEKAYDWRQALLYAVDRQKDKALGKIKFISWYRKVVVFSLLNMTDESISVIEKRYEYHQKNRMSLHLFLKYHPWLENTRSHPRFQEILARHKELYDENLRKYGDIDI
jgi:serine/threonine protein kinase